jgi:hypothetical protein
MMPQIQHFNGTLDIQGSESFLDNTVMAMDLPACGDLDCRIEAARNHFVGAGCPIGSSLSVDGFFVSEEPDGHGDVRDVLHVTEDHSPCSASQRRTS